MTEQTNPPQHNGEAITVGEIFPPAASAATGTKAGSTEDLKALHADLTAAYRDYLEMAKIKPKMLSATMLGLIQQFLKQNDIGAEAPEKLIENDQQRRLEERRKAREVAMSRQNIVNLNQSKRG